ncbi:Fanconi anemia group B protein [Trichomycterus rosablanca]|uniref:Fanconi anemia group B protein n=1 Tax=Trichomycterus rosablanca TaxID=2290929 RepID=UPI002F35CA4F
MAFVEDIQMVTLQGEVMVFRCKYLTSRSSEVTFWRTSFQEDSGIFSNKDDKTVTLFKGTSRGVSIVQCSTAVNIKTRQKVPQVLLKICKKGGFKYMLLSLSSNNNAEVHVEFSLPYEMSGVSILHGPTLLWSYQDTIFYTSSQADGVKEVPFCMKVSFVFELPLRHKKLGILGSRMVQKQQMKSDGKDKPILYFIEDGRTFRGDCLIPDIYSSVVCCLVVLNIKEIDGSLRSSLVAATSKKQLVYFENGLPEEVCVLPFEEPQSIRIVHTGTGCLIVVGFEHGNVCAVWRETFKVAACWRGVQRLLVDDFIGGGFEQMLLLFEDEDIFGKFLLTDLCGVHYSAGRTEGEDTNQCEMTEENVVFTIQALDAQLQSGLTFLQNLQRDVHVKDRVIQQCASALQHLLSDRKHFPSPAQQEGLVSLLDEESEEDQCFLDERMKTDSDDRISKVERVWHRVVGKNLIFGVLLTSANHIMKGENVMTAVLSAHPMVQSRTKILSYPEPDTCGAPSAKRSRLSSGPAVLVITDLATLLMFNSTSCSILLNFPSDGTNGASQQCEVLTFELKGALDGKLHPRLLEDCSVDSDESREDLLSLMAAFQSWSFHISSTDRTMVDVVRFIKEKCGADQVKINPQYLLSRSTLSSTSMLFYWKLWSNFSGLLTIYCSDHLDLLRLVDSLCSFLPASHHIQLLKSGRGNQKNPALCMEREIQMVKEGMADLIRGEVQESVSGAVRGAALQISPEQWHRERNAVRLRPVVEAELYRRLVEKIIDVQIDSDVSVLVEAELS